MVATEQATEGVDVSQPKAKYRMVALDLDGTLLSSDQIVSIVARDYLRYLNAQGFTVILATGRAIPTVYKTVMALNFPKPLPVVCSNGAEGVLCTVNNTGNAMSGGVKKEPLFYNPVPPNVADRVIELATMSGFATQYYVGDTIYANPSAPHHFKLTQLYQDLTASKTIYVTDDFQQGKDEGAPSKLLILGKPKEQDGMIQIFEEELAKEEYRIKSDDSNPNSSDVTKKKKNTTTIVRGNLGWFIEILHPHVNKGHGLQQMCQQHLHIPLEECVAFGDGDNDYEFLQMAGKGVAMKNAREVVKEIADEVIEYNNNENGVIKTLQRMEEQGELIFQDHAEDKEIVIEF